MKMRTSEIKVHNQAERQVIREADSLWWNVKRMYKQFGDLERIELFLDEDSKDFTIKIICGEESEEEA